MSTGRATDALSSVSRIFRDSSIFNDQQYHAIYLHSVSRVLAIERYAGFPRSSNLCYNIGSSGDRRPHAIKRLKTSHAANKTSRWMSTASVRSTRSQNPSRPARRFISSRPGSVRPALARPGSRPGSRPMPTSTPDDIEFEGLPMIKTDEEEAEELRVALKLKAEQDERQRLLLLKLAEEQREADRKLREQQWYDQERIEAIRKKAWNEANDFVDAVGNLKQRIIQKDNLAIFASSRSKWLQSELRKCYQIDLTNRTSEIDKLDTAINDHARRIEVFQAESASRIQELTFDMAWRDMWRSSKGAVLREVQNDLQNTSSIIQEADMSIKERSYVFDWIYWRSKQLRYQQKAVIEADQRIKLDVVSAINRNQAELQAELSSLIVDALDVLPKTPFNQEGVSFGARTRFSNAVHKSAPGKIAWLYQEVHLRAKLEVDIQEQAHALRDHLLKSCKAVIFPEAMAFEAAATAMRRAVADLRQDRNNLELLRPQILLLDQLEDREAPRSKSDRSRDWRQTISKFRTDANNKLIRLTDKASDMLDRDHAPWNVAANRPGFELIRQKLENHHVQRLNVMALTRSVDRGLMRRKPESVRSVRRWEEVIVKLHAKMHWLRAGNRSISKLLSEMSQNDILTTLHGGPRVGPPPRLPSSGRGSRLQKSLDIFNHDLAQALVAKHMIDKAPTPYMAIQSSIPSRSTLSLPVQYVITQPALEEAVKELRQQKIIGMDIPMIWATDKSFVRMPQVISFSTPSKSYLIEITNQLRVDTLCVLFEDPNVGKVIHDNIKSSFAQCLGHLTLRPQSLFTTYHDDQWSQLDIAWIADRPQFTRPTFQFAPRMETYPAVGDLEKERVIDWVADVVRSSLFNLYIFMKAMTPSNVSKLTQTGARSLFDSSWSTKTAKVRQELCNLSPEGIRTVPIGPITWDTSVLSQSTGMIATAVGKSAVTPDLLGLVNTVVTTANPSSPSSTSKVITLKRSLDQAKSSLPSKLSMSAWLLYATFNVDLSTIARLLKVVNPIPHILEVNDRVIPAQAVDVKEIRNMMSTVFDITPLPRGQAPKTMVIDHKPRMRALRIQPEPHITEKSWELPRVPRRTLDLKEKVAPSQTENFSVFSQPQTEQSGLDQYEDDDHDADHDADLDVDLDVDLDDDERIQPEIRRVTTDFPTTTITIYEDKIRETCLQSQRIRHELSGLASAIRRRAEDIRSTEEAGKKMRMDEEAQARIAILNIELRAHNRSEVDLWQGLQTERAKLSTTSTDDLYANNPHIAGQLDSRSPRLLGPGTRSIGLSAPPKISVKPEKSERRSGKSESLSRSIRANLVTPTKRKSAFATMESIMQETHGNTSGHRENVFDMLLDEEPEEDVHQPFTAQSSIFEDKSRVRRGKFTPSHSMSLKTFDSLYDPPEDDSVIPEKAGIVTPMEYHRKE